jgi:hypothetical protein
MLSAVLDEGSEGVKSRRSRGEDRRAAEAPQLLTPTAGFDDRTGFAGWLGSLRSEKSPTTVGAGVKRLILLRKGRIIDRAWRKGLLSACKKLLVEPQVPAC